MKNPRLPFQSKLSTPSLQPVSIPKTMESMLSHFKFEPEIAIWGSKFVLHMKGKTHAPANDDRADETIWFKTSPRKSDTNWNIYRFFFPSGRHTETGRGWANGTRDSKFNLHTLPVRLFLLPGFWESAVRKMSEFRLKWRETILERFIEELWMGKEDENLSYIFQLRKSLLKIIKMGDSSYFVNFAKFINRLKWKASTPPWFNF